MLLSSKVLLRPVAAMRAHQGLPVLLRSSISNSSGVGKRQISLALKNSGNGNKRQLSSFLRPSHHGGLDNGRKVLIGIVGGEYRCVCSLEVGRNESRTII
jgi:hypothetical protein